MIQVEQRATDGGTLQMRATYSYDVFGNRVEKRVDSDGDNDVDVHEKYAYDGWHIWAELDGTGSLANRYVHGDVIDQVFIRIEADGDPFWYLTDRLGSVRNLTNDDGDLLSTYSYDAFGKLLNSPAIDERLGHTGREYDAETGLYYHWWRYRDPATNQWTTEDPIGFGAGDPNLRRHVGNNVTNLIDPSGLEVVDGKDGFAYWIYPGGPKGGVMVGAIDPDGRIGLVTPYGGGYVTWKELKAMESSWNKPEAEPEPPIPKGFEPGNIDQTLDEAKTKAQSEPPLVKPQSLLDRVKDYGNYYCGLGKAGLEGVGEGWGKVEEAAGELINETIDAVKNPKQTLENIKDGLIQLATDPRGTLEAMAQSFWDDFNKDPSKALAKFGLGILVGVAGDKGLSKLKAAAKASKLAEKLKIRYALFRTFENAILRLDSDS